MTSPVSRRSGARSALFALALATGSAALVAAPADGATSYPVDRTLKDSRITESSGIARSTYSRDVLFTHNDSGDTNRVFAVKPDGSTAAVLTIAGAKHRDWEDISSGPNHTLWIGDIGDNSKRRSTIQVYRFTEPSTLKSTSVQSTKFELKYPDGSHNAEGMLVHPSTGRLYVVTKQDSGAAVYAAPTTLSTSSVNRMTKVTSAPAMMSAASFSPDGSKIVIAGYSKAYVYRSFGSTPDVVRKNAGESIEITRNGAVLSGTEGKQSPVYRLPAS